MDAGGHARSEGVRDDCVIGIGNLMHVSLEGEMPVLDGPALRVFHRWDNLNRGQPVRFIEDQYRRDRDAEGVRLARFLRVLALPDRRVVVLPVVRCHLNDPTERLNALAPLVDPDASIKDLRDSYLVNSREQGQLRARDVEIALGRLAPSRTAGPGKPLAQLHAQIAAAFSSDRSVPSALREAHDHASAIQTLMADRVGASRAIDLGPLVQPLDALLEVCDVALGTGTAVAEGAEGEPATGQRPGAGGEIRTREDAMQMLELVCRYMERHEPSNPAPLFIRRGQRLIQMNFVEIVKDLMPDSLGQLEKLAGEFEKT